MKLRIFLIGLILFLSGLIIYFLNSKNNPALPYGAAPDNIAPALINKSDVGDCISEEQTVTLRGDSLTGFLEDGASLKILVDYYKCHQLERDDVVAYHYGGNSVPIVKIAKAVEGDTFHLKQSDSGCWNILVNNEMLKNSQNIPYCFADSGYKMLSLYEQDYKGVVPANSALIFGNLPGGSADSSRFGIIDKGDVLGKVEY